MLILDPNNLDEHIGKDTGVSEWFEVTQDIINDFATLTVDPQFIHVDPEQAAKTRFGGTIAHGFLVLSMLTHFVNTGMGVRVKDAEILINYGFDKIRFLFPVRAGKRVRGRASLQSADHTKPKEIRACLKIEVEIEGESKPALIAEWVVLILL